MYTVVGSGLIGSYLQSQVDCRVYTRGNIQSIDLTNHDTIIVAAPTSNRIWANNHVDEDLLNCKQLYEQLSKCQYQQLILISTVDTFVNNSYGKNRLWLEHSLMHLPNVKVIRLPMICHHSIKKNMLYDIKNECWLDKISIDSKFQYYPLDRLSADICSIVNNPQTWYNLTSCPISNRYLIEKYKPKLLNVIESNNLLPQTYDIKNYNNEYAITESDILTDIDKYFL